jgi:hypothetical protein
MASFTDQQFAPPLTCMCSKPFFKEAMLQLLEVSSERLQIEPVRLSRNTCRYSNDVKDDLHVSLAFAVKNLCRKTKSVLLSKGNGEKIKQETPRDDGPHPRRQLPSVSLCRPVYFIDTLALFIGGWGGRGVEGWLVVVVLLSLPPRAHGPSLLAGRLVVAMEEEAHLEDDLATRATTTATASASSRTTLSSACRRIFRGLSSYTLCLSRLQSSRDDDDDDNDTTIVLWRRRRRLSCSSAVTAWRRRRRRRFSTRPSSVRRSRC